MSERDSKGELKYQGGAKEERHYLVCNVMNDGEDMRVAVTKGKAWFTEYSVPHPVVLVPLDDIISKVILDCFDELEKDHNAREGL